LLIAENTPPKAIQEHLRHACFAITMDRYGHLFPSASEQVRDALERAFG
jgi:integrase